MKSELGQGGVGLTMLPAAFLKQQALHRSIPVMLGKSVPVMDRAVFITPSFLGAHLSFSKIATNRVQKAFSEPLQQKIFFLYEGGGNFAHTYTAIGYFCKERYSLI